MIRKLKKMEEKMVQGN
jgi:hypothetical protein